MLKFTQEKRLEFNQIFAPIKGMVNSGLALHSAVRFDQVLS